MEPKYAECFIKRSQNYGLLISVDVPPSSTLIAHSPIQNVYKSASCLQVLYLHDIISIPQYLQMMSFMPGDNKWNGWQRQYIITDLSG